MSEVKRYGIADLTFYAPGAVVIEEQADGDYVTFSDYESLRQRCAELEAQLGECFRLAGGDTDGQDPIRCADRAVEVVRDLRECYEERGREDAENEANARRYLFVRDADGAIGPMFTELPDDSGYRMKRGEELDAAIDAAAQPQGE